MQNAPFSGVHLSSSKVGYQEVPVEASGFTLITPTFDKVDGSSITLKDIGAKNSYESVQLLNTDAGTDAEYFFVSKEDSGLEADGWFLDDLETPADDVAIPEGKSILFSSLGTESITFAGQVATTGKPVTTEESGFTMIGNNTPVDVALKNLVCTGINSYDSIQFMDENLSTAQEYFFVAKEDSGLEADGWFCDDLETPADDIVIPAGSGVLFSATAGAVTVTVPAAL